MWRLGLLFAVLVTPLAVLAVANPAWAAPDVTVTVTILRFEEVNCPDDDVFEPCPGDYYSKVAIHDSGLQISTRAPDDTAPHNPAGWTFTKTVDKALGTISIAIELHDHDDEGPDEWVDIAPGDNTLNLTLNLNSGSWSGDQPITTTYRWVRCGSDGGNSDGSNCSSHRSTLGGESAPSISAATASSAFRAAAIG